jgi:hypothetical protein
VVAVARSQSELVSVFAPVLALELVLEKVQVLAPELALALVPVLVKVPGLE